jgi:hypothetical protein
MASMLLFIDQAAKWTRCVFTFFSVRAILSWLQAVRLASALLSTLRLDSFS